MNDSLILQRLQDVYNNNLDIHEQRAIINDFLQALERGHIRAAYKSPQGFEVDSRVKQGIIHAFSVGHMQAAQCGPLSFIDKDNLWPRHFTLDDNVRIVPGGSCVRRGAYIGKNVVIMPPAYINVGAYVDDKTLIDSHALVGSCAQIGKRVHISAAAQVGGVLEPISALPVIIEDDVLVGGNCGLYEGVHIGAKAVLGAGVILTKSTKVYDIVNERIIKADDTQSLVIPEGAVVVMGARAILGRYAEENNLSIATPIIIKYRDHKTDAKTALLEALR